MCSPTGRSNVAANRPATTRASGGAGGGEAGEVEGGLCPRDADGGGRFLPGRRCQRRSDERVEPDTLGVVEGGHRPHRFGGRHPDETNPPPCRRFAYLGWHLTRTTGLTNDC